MYETVNIPDTSIRVLTEEQIDRKFPAKTVWEQFFLKDNDTPQLVLKQKNPKGEYHKVGGKFKIGSEGFRDDTHSMIYIINSGVMNNHMRILKERQERQTGNKKKVDSEFIKNTIYEIMHISRYDSNGDMVKVFTNCESKCHGFVEGHYVSEKYDDIGGLAGSRGVNYNCRRCGSQLGADVFVRS